MYNLNNESLLYDVFICHASKDKEAIVRPLAELLRENHIEVWYDEFELQIGDSIRRAIDKGLRKSRFGIVVLSKEFFQKEWPQYELDGLVEKEIIGRQKVILPIWHEVDQSYVARYSHSLAGRFAANTVIGLAEVANQLSRVIKPQASPLIIARDFLIEMNITPPVITDKHWLNVIEASNNMLPFGAVPESETWGRWSFPLPPKTDDPQRWGERLAWAYMQMNWAKEAEETPITPLTPFQEVLDFISRHPGLFETCQEIPSLLVEWAPQLVIPGFEGALFETIEQAYQKSCSKKAGQSKYNKNNENPLTIDENSPLCDEEFALRDPMFGNYKPLSIAEAYFHGDIFGPTTSPYEEADHLFWLLSQKSDWLPATARECLLEGVASWTRWRWHDHEADENNRWNNCGALASAFFKVSTARTFKLTKAMESDLEHRIAISIKVLNLPESVVTIKDRFLAYHVIEKTIAAEKEIKNSQMGRKKKENKRKT
jgi:hypothetical protein